MRFEEIMLYLLFQYIELCKTDEGQTNCSCLKNEKITSICVKANQTQDRRDHCQ